MTQSHDQDHPATWPRWQPHDQNDTITWPRWQPHDHDDSHRTKVTATGPRWQPHDQCINHKTKMIQSHDQDDSHMTKLTTTGPSWQPQDQVTCVAHGHKIKWRGRQPQLYVESEVATSAVKRRCCLLQWGSPLRAGEDPAALWGVRIEGWGKVWKTVNKKLNCWAFYHHFFRSSPEKKHLPSLPFTSPSSGRFMSVQEVVKMGCKRIHKEWSAWVSKYLTTSSTVIRIHINNQAQNAHTTKTIWKRITLQLILNFNLNLKASTLALAYKENTDQTGPTQLSMTICQSL